MRLRALFVCVSAWAQVDYQTQIHPVLAAKCFACHGGDKRSGGLSLRDYQSVIDGGRSGAVIIPQASRDSLLIQRVTGEMQPKMPPAGPALTETELATLRSWIDQGARSAPTAPPSKPRFVPTLELNKSAGSLEDLLAAYYKRNNVKVSAVSDAAYARRVYLDIWGLVPSPEQLAEFTTDRGSDKRARLVRQLLAHRDNYAGHWFTFWNDLLRNEDSFGTYGGDRKSISKWLEGSLQANLPGNQFLGQLLNPTRPEDPDGFLTGVNWRGDSSASQMPWIQAAANSAQIFLGINLKCNACHDSFISKWKLKDAYGLAAYYSPDPKLELVRCDAKTGEVTGPQFLYPSLNRPSGESLQERHAAAAEMFLDPKNGRTPRTIVNRYWAQLMGRGIVEPRDDMDGEPWSPEVLDWLAAELVARNWDFQWLIETIVASSAYQLPAVAEPAPAKGFVFRGPQVRRVTAEQLIDSLSAITGEWPVLERGNQKQARYVREAHRPASPLSLALGRPFRDQVITERATDATTLQMLELVNGKGLYQHLHRGALRLLGQEPPAPPNLFDSLVMRATTAPVKIDLDVSNLKEVWLVVADQGSYSPGQVKTDWAGIELVTADGSEKIADLQTGAVETHKLDLRGKNAKRLQATVRVNPESDRSDISPSVRFFVFGNQPNYNRLIPVLDQRPVSAPPAGLTRDELVRRIFRQALGRDATAEEFRLAQATVSDTPTSEQLTDLLWAVAASPEFQLIL